MWNARSAPVEATVSSVELFGDKREGMRRVRVGLTVGREGTSSRRVVVTEWIPLVLLGRLTTGRVVTLMHDPVDDRTTFAL